MPAPRRMRVLLLNGKNGHPLANEKVLIFFEQERTTSLHDRSVNVATDAAGAASIPLEEDARPFMEVFINLRSACWDHPNAQRFAVDEVMRQGLSTPNTCGKAHTAVSPGELVIYARAAGLREKMGW